MQGMFAGSTTPAAAAAAGREGPLRPCMVPLGLHSAEQPMRAAAKGNSDKVLDKVTATQVRCGAPLYGFRILQHCQGSRAELRFLSVCFETLNVRQSWAPTCLCEQDIAGGVTAAAAAAPLTPEHARMDVKHALNEISTAMAAALSDNQLSIQHVLGQGAYGTVYKGEELGTHASQTYMHQLRLTYFARV